MDWEWGPWVKFCRLFGADYCRFCVVVNRAYHQLILGRNPTFIGWQPPKEEHIPEDANYI